MFLNLFIPVAPQVRTSDINKKEKKMPQRHNTVFVMFPIVLFFSHFVSYSVQKKKK